jgi:acetyl esterase/lipase
MTRALLIILLFLISLLSLFKAPAYYLWLLAIAVTEYPLFFATITTVLVLSGFWVQKYQLLGTLVGLIAICVFLSPIVKAYVIGYDLNSEFNDHFDHYNKVVKAQGDGDPFSISKMFVHDKPIPSKTITYVKFADTALTLDYYPSQIVGKKPCIIVVHGGSWSSGDSKQLPELNSKLARDGYNVTAINYRMAPKYQSPAPVEDVRSALKYLQQHADELNIDPNNFVLLGRSAGAQIALLAAYTLNEASIKGVIDLYGPADMVWGYSIPSNPLIMNSRAVMEAYLGGSYSMVPKNYAASSPVAFVSKRSVPTLIIHGQNDVLVAYDHSRRLSEKLDADSVKSYWLKLPWATHGFDYNLNGPSGQLSTYTVGLFLKAVLPATH